MENSDSSQQQIVPLVIVGDTNVGKSCILQYFIDGYLKDTIYATGGPCFIAKSINIEGKRVKLEIWDISGKEQYRSLNKLMYNSKEGVIFTYSIDDKDSFRKLSQFLQDAEDHAREEFCKILVGNKKDTSERQVAYDEGKQFAESQKMEFIETSARTGEGIAELFEILTRDILQKGSRSKRLGGFKLNPETKSENKTASRCC